MRQSGVGMVHTEGATRAALLPIWAEHEVINNELTLALEEVGKSLLTFRRIEDIVFFDFDPGKLPTFGGNRIALPRELLLFGQ